MPAFQIPAVTAHFDKVKVNGVVKLTSRVYENGVLIYDCTEKDPAKHKVYTQNFIEARRRYNTRLVLGQMEN